MQTLFSADVSDTPKARIADTIIRKCVHCGLCNATCPTYQLSGNELDGPRGRIYLIKQALENNAASTYTRTHLDRCLSCRACETICPSGVEFERLLEIGRDHMGIVAPRSWTSRLRYWLLQSVLSSPKRFSPLLALGRFLAPVFPTELLSMIPRAQRKAAKIWPQRLHTRQTLTLSGCVQSTTFPQINIATARVLDQAGISLVNVPEIDCCGAVKHHLSATEGALTQIRNNIDAWWPRIEAGAESITITSTACAAMVKQYRTLLADDPEYATKAKRISALVRDLSETVSRSRTCLSFDTSSEESIAFHSPCTLQHGQRIVGIVEKLLQQAGYRLTPVADGHLCCGSAGAYSILQPVISKQLLNDKLKALQASQPSAIATANIGCMLHLARGAKVPVYHWIELAEARLINLK